MHILANLAFGFHIALTPINVAYCLLGALIGTLVGVLPGLGPVTTIAMLLPITFQIPAVSSLIMLAGIYYGAHHAGSTTAVMLNMPGEPTSVVICIDGHPMARQGRAGVALFVSAVGSFFAGCVGVIVIATLSPVLAHAALLFGPVEYTSMIVMALVMASVLTAESPLTPIAMATLGVLLGTVGTDVSSGVQRFTFGNLSLVDGFSIVAAATGLFAFAEVGVRAAASAHPQHQPARMSSIIPTIADLKAIVMPILRGTLLGGAFGVLPGTGPLISSFTAYALEKQISRHPERFGNGAIEGVAGPEAANNASAITHFIPMLALGIPAGAANALMLGALTMQGITPGPEILTKHADLFWGIIASMWIGNLMLLVLNLPLVGLWVRLLTIPYRLLYPMVLVFCCIGVYSVNNQVDDILVAAAFGTVGYLFRKLDCPPAPLILGLVLGPSLETHFRRALLLSRGDPSVFFTSPISVAMMVLTLAYVVLFRMRAKAGNMREHTA